MTMLMVLNFSDFHTAPTLNETCRKQLKEAIEFMFSVRFVSLPVSFLHFVSVCAYCHVPFLAPRGQVASNLSL